MVLLPFIIGIGLLLFHSLIMLTFNRTISALFMIDFERMIAIHDRHVMMCLGAVTFTFTLAHVVQEAVVRRLRCLDHFARMSIFEYLGKVVRIKYVIC